MHVDVFAPRALREARNTGAYAARIRVWPPEGYTAPTGEEFAALRQAAHRFDSGAMYRAHWERMTDETVARRLQLLEILPRTDRRDEHAAYEYAHALRREANRRKLAHRSIRLHRCESCSHGTERLFEATQETHPGLVNPHEEKIRSAWFCARCWSGRTWGDEDEAEDDE